MNRYTRRKFLKIAALNAGGLFLSSSLLKASSLSCSSSIDDKKISLQKEARETFYRRLYDRAETLYKQYIDLYPQDVFGYDGLAKVYKVLRKYPGIIELYQSALQINPSNPVFYDRLARTMNTLSLGNHKQEQDFISASGKSFLLESSALLYLQAIELDGSKKYLYEGLLDTVRCLKKKNIQLQKAEKPVFMFSGDLSEKIASITKAYEESWNQSRIKQPNKGKNTGNLILSLEKMEKKKRRTLYFEDEKQCRKNSLSKKRNEFVYPFFLQSVREHQTEKAEEYFDQMDHSVYKNTYSQFLLTKLYKKNKEYGRLISFREKIEDEKKNPFWNRVNSAQAIVLDAIKDNNVTRLDRALNLYEQALLHKDFMFRNPKAVGALYQGIALCYFGKNEFEKGYEALQTALKSLPPASGIALSLLINYAENCVRTSSTGRAEEILLRLSGISSASSVKDDVFIDSYIQERESQFQWEEENNIRRWRKDRKENGKKKKRSYV